MGTDPRFGHVVAFGGFEVNVLTGELRKHGVRLALQEQPLRILAALLERPGEVVTREALCRRLWPLGTFVDFEHSLNAAVRRLRVTLGDEADTRQDLFGVLGRIEPADADRSAGGTEQAHGQVQ